MRRSAIDDPEVEAAFDLVGDEWWKHAFGGVHTAGNVALSAFGLGKYGEQLQTLEHEAGLLPEWAQPAAKPTTPAQTTTQQTPRPPSPPMTTSATKRPLISATTGKPIPSKKPPTLPPGQRPGASAAATTTTATAAPPRQILPGEVSALALGGAVGGAIGGGLGLLLWPSHRFLGAAVGFLFFGSPIGSAVGLLIARRKR